jgi:hypothetical protein
MVWVPQSSGQEADRRAVRARLEIARHGRAAFVAHDLRGLDHPHDPALRLGGLDDPTNDLRLSYEVLVELRIAVDGQTMDMSARVTADTVAGSTRVPNAWVAPFVFVLPSVQLTDLPMVPAFDGRCG